MQRLLSTLTLILAAVGLATILAAPVAWWLLDARGIDAEALSAAAWYADASEKQREVADEILHADPEKFDRSFMESKTDFDKRAETKARSLLSTDEDLLRLKRTDPDAAWAKALSRAESTLRALDSSKMKLESVKGEADLYRGFGDEMWREVRERQAQIDKARTDIRRLVEEFRAATAGAIREDNDRRRAGLLEALKTAEEPQDAAKILEVLEPKDMVYYVGNLAPTRRAAVINAITDDAKRTALIQAYNKNNTLSSPEAAQVLGISEESMNVVRPLLESDADKAKTQPPASGGAGPK